MTRPPRGAMQIKSSRDTMGIKPASSKEKRDAQRVVCQYVKATFPELDERGQITEVKELLDILGIAGR